MLNQDTTKAVSTQRKSNQEKFEDTNMVIRSRKSKDGQYNRQEKKDKVTNNPEHCKRLSSTNFTKNVGDLMCSGRANT